MSTYKIILNRDSFIKAENYLKSLHANEIAAGKYLQSSLQNIDLNNLNTEDFLEILINTKQPQIFAESSVHGNGADWNHSELSILGDIAIANPVKIFDNGIHVKPHIYHNPYPGFLMFIPGALLENMKNQIPADWKEVVRNNNIDVKFLYKLYERRFLAPFAYINEMCKMLNKQALITIPGIGCGQFSGRFRGSMGSFLERVMHVFLKKHIGSLPNIKVVYYDPFDECDNKRIQIKHLTYLIRPLRKGNENKSQLCKVTDYQDDKDDFNSLILFSIVAWDHVSWPGNDFFIGSRATDDGVKAAATNSMEVMTGFTGYYHDKKNKYLPPRNYNNWKEVIEKNKIQIKVKSNLFIYPSL